MSEQLTIGDVIRGTIETAREHQRAIAIFVVVFALLGTAIEWGADNYAGDLANFDLPSWAMAAFGLGAGIGGLLLAIMMVIGQYLLWEHMLGTSNYLRPDMPKRYFAFFFQALLIGLCVGFGFILLIIPGLIFGARWAAAPAFLIAENKSITEGMGSSWDMIRGNTVPIVVASILAGLAILVLNFMLGGAAFSALGGTVPGLNGLMVLASHVVGQLGTILGICLGVFLFGRLHGPSEQLSQVFE